MKFKLLMVNDDDNPIRTYDFSTWYGDDSVKSEILKNGMDKLEQVSDTITRSLKSEIETAVRSVLFVDE